jgi:glycosyltransferase involved in cell wall biosynthesis
MHRIKVIRVIARLNIGGPAIHTILLTAGLDPTRFESTLVTGIAAAHEGNMLDLASQKGVQPLVIPQLGRDINLLRDWATLIKLFFLFRDRRPHIVHTHTAKAGTVGRVAARLAGVPIVVHTFHGHVFHSYFGPRKTRLFIKIERALARFTDRIIAISPAQYQDIVHTYRIAPSERVVTIPLGLDLQPFCTARQAYSGQFRSSLGISSDTMLVGFVGRLTGVKDPSLFIEAASRVVGQMPATRFVFVGDGELRPTLEQEVKALGLTRQILFAGWQTVMPVVYADLDLLVLSSLNEGTPVTVIEALAAGTPVVATAVGGVPDVIVDQKTGVLVPSGDVEALAQAVVRLLRDRECAEELARVGQQSVLDRFSFPRLVGDIESLYLALLREKGKHRARPDMDGARRNSV